MSRSGGWFKHRDGTWRQFEAPAPPPDKVLAIGPICRGCGRMSISGVICPDCVRILGRLLPHRPAISA